TCSTPCLPDALPICAGRRVDGNGTHLLHRQDNAALHSRASARKSRTSPAGHHRYTVCCSKADRGLDIFSIVSPHHGHRITGLGSVGPIPAITIDCSRTGNHTVLTNGINQLLKFGHIDGRYLRHPWTLPHQNSIEIGRAHV